MGYEKFLMKLQCKLGLEEFDEIVKYCPNLENLHTCQNEEYWLDDEAILSAEGIDRD
jgi:hypothetical protein